MAAPSPSSVSVNTGRLPLCQALHKPGTAAGSLLVRSSCENPGAQLAGLLHPWSSGHLAGLLLEA
jgi:hypothetical protein